MKPPSPGQHESVSDGGKYCKNFLRKAAQNEHEEICFHENQGQNWKIRGLGGAVRGVSICNLTFATKIYGGGYVGGVPFNP